MIGIRARALTLGARMLAEQMLRIVILLSPSTVALAQAQDWLTYVQGLGFGERLTEIRSVSQLPKAAQRDRVSALIHLLRDADQSVRLTAAAEIAEIRDVSDAALPRLIENFERGRSGRRCTWMANASAKRHNCSPRALAGSALAL